MLKISLKKLFYDMARVVERQRKRKMDSHLRSVSGDNSGICAKSSKVYSGQQVTEQFYPSGHVATVFLGDVIPKFESKQRFLFAGDTRSEPCTSLAASSSSPKYKPFHFECPIGDVLQERYDHSTAQAKGRRKVKVTTGDCDFDVAVSRLRQDGSYVVRELLSKTRHSSILLVSRPGFGEDVVLKFLKKGRTAHSKRLMCCEAPEDTPGLNELNILRRLHHPNIVQLLFEDSLNNVSYMMLGFCHGGNLDELLQSLPSGLLCEYNSRKYINDVSAGLEYLHSQSVAHCGLSCQQILLDQRNRARICGFRNAVHHTLASEPLLDALPLTPYQAPEAILRQPILDPRKLDVWALGVMLYRMLTGQFIFGKIVKKIPFKAMSGPRIDRNVYVLSAPVTDLMEQLLTASLDDRPSVFMARQAPWLSTQEKRTRIGYHYLVARPARGTMSTMERNMKEAHGI